MIAFALLATTTAVASPPDPTKGMLSGTWAVVSSDVGGRPFDHPPKGTLFTFAGGKVTVGPKRREGTLFATFKADPTRNPPEIDLVQEVGKRKVILHGIYRIEKGRLVLCVGTASGSGDPPVIEGKRPTEFRPGPEVLVLTPQRVED
jgi:uncharacterized protein (TIGR03067 family)